MQTLEAMAGVVDARASHPFVRRLAENFRSGGPEAVFAWLKRTQQFADDPPGVEVIADPLVILDPAASGSRDPESKWIGDCDDVAVIGATIGKALGWRVALAVCNRRGKAYPFAHVLWGIIGEGGEFSPMDSQEAANPGEWPKWATRKGVYKW